MLAMAVAFFAGPAPSARAEGVGVNAIDNSFSPASITIDVGDTITWSNTGDNPHTTTSGQRGVSGSGSLWEQTLNLGISSSAVSFDTAGTFLYFCKFHQGMDGTVTVQAAATATPTQQPTATPTPEPTSGAIVIAIDNSFSPVSITIDVGDTVIWSNNGENPHTTTNGERRADGAGNVWDQTLNLGESSTVVSFGTAGTFPYHCKFHQGMDGTVTVQAAATAIPGQPEATAILEPNATPTSVPAATSTPEPASEPTAAPEPTASSTPEPAAAPVATTQAATPEPAASGGFCAPGAAAGSGVPSLLLLIAPLGALVVRRRRRG